MCLACDTSEITSLPSAELSVRKRHAVATADVDVMHEAPDQDASAPVVDAAQLSA